MKVVNVIRTSRGASWLVPQLLKLRDLGNDVHVILPRADEGLGIILLSSGFQVSETVVRIDKLYNLINFMSLYRLRKQIQRLNPEVVVYQLIQTAIWCRLALVGTKFRKVFQVPGPLFLETPMLRILERSLSALDDFIICGSFYTYIKYLDLGVSKTKLSPTAFGVDTRKFTRSMTMKERRIRRVELGIPEEATVFIMVAYAYPPKSLVFRGRGIKGHETLIAAWGKFSNIEKNVFLILVGDEWPAGAYDYKDALEASLEAHSNVSSFKWFSGVTDPRDFYEISDISVSPSLSDNHGAVLEASSMEVPSIISSAGALTEGLPSSWPWVFAPEDTAGLYDCLRSSLLAHSRGELRSMGSLARKHVEERFDCYACADDIAAAILSK